MSSRLANTKNSLNNKLLGPIKKSKNKTERALLGMSSYHEDVSFLLFREAPGAICKRPPHHSSPLSMGSSRHLLQQRTPVARKSMETGNTGCLSEPV